MKNKQTIVEIAYNFLCKKKKSSFVEIWAHVKKQCNITKEEEEKSAGDLYTGIILDTNFFLKNDKFWYPRSEVSLEEIKEQMTKITLPTLKDESDTTSTIGDDTEETMLDLNKNINEDEDTELINMKPIEDDYDE